MLFVDERYHDIRPLERIAIHKGIARFYIIFEFTSQEKRTFLYIQILLCTEKTSVRFSVGVTLGATQV